MICLQIKPINASLIGLLCSLPIPKQVWEDISMNFITSMPTSQGFTTLLVVVDMLTKYAHFGTLPTSFKAMKVFALFINTVVRLHGFLKTIISNRDSVFFSTFWRHLLTISGTKLHFSTTYHPESDGQTKVLNRSLEQYLRVYTS